MENFLDGFNRKEATFYVFENINKGDTVTFVDPCTVECANSGALFIGVCTSTDNVIGSIQLEGYVRVSFSGTAPDLGYVKLSADGSGGVKADENGRYVIVTDTDNETGTCGIIL